jgi:glycosyltransferase involved in cell wall biosynthesis
MADRIIKLLKDDALRARMGEAALKRARQHFTVDRMVEGTLATYETLVGSRR